MKRLKPTEHKQIIKKSRNNMIGSKELIFDSIESYATTEELIARTRRILSESAASIKKHIHVRFNSED